MIQLTKNTQVGIPSPNPSFPSPVNVVKGDNEVVVGNKNVVQLDFTNDSDTVAGMAFTHTDNTFTLKGTATSTYKIFTLRNFPNVQNGETYTLTAKATGTNPKATVSIYFRQNQQTHTSRIRVTTPTQTSVTDEVDLTNVTYATFVIEGLQNGQYYDMTCDVQLEKGSSSTSFQPHAEQVYPINLGVENLLQLSSATSITANTTINGNAITIQQIGNYGTTTWEVSNLQANTQYTLSFELTAKETNYNPYYRVSNTSGTDSYTATSGLGNYFKTITTDSNGKAYFSVRPTSASSVTGSATIQNIQLEKGSKVNSFTPYGTTPIELAKIGTYQDKLFKAISGDVVYDSLSSTQKEGLTEGKWYKYGDIEKYNSWSSAAATSVLTNCIRSQFKLSLATTYEKRQYALSNFFINSITNNDYEHIFIGTGDANVYNGLNVFIDKTRATTDAEVINWLQTNNVAFYYVLATPTFTEITDTTLIQQLENWRNSKSYNGQTNISQTNDDKAFIISYTTLKDVYAELDSRLKALEG